MNEPTVVCQTLFWALGVQQRAEFLKTHHTLVALTSDGWGWAVNKSNVGVTAYVKWRKRRCRRGGRELRDFLLKRVVGEAS